LQNLLQMFLADFFSALNQEHSIIKVGIQPKLDMERVFFSFVAEGFWKIS